MMNASSMFPESFYLSQQSTTSSFGDHQFHVPVPNATTPPSQKSSSAGTGVADEESPDFYIFSGRDGCNAAVAAAASGTNDGLLFERPQHEERVITPTLDHEDGNDILFNGDDIDTLPISSGGTIPHTDYRLTESLIAKKMSQLTMEERETVYHDIHAVTGVVDEKSEPGFLNRKLNELEMEIQRIDFRNRQAYELALCLAPAYVRDSAFRLRFLRADRFNAKLAAERYTRHYQLKLELFGPQKLGRHIIQDDLDKEALDKLYSGMNQSLPKRDTAGRLVWILIPRPQERPPCRETVLRRIFYNNMVLSEDLETQRRGAVGIIYTLNQQQTKKGFEGRNKIQDISEMLRSLPMPIASIHFCYDSLAWLPVLSIAQLSSNLFLQLRFRAHYGSHSECVLRLQTFGIPAETIPINEKGKVSSTGHLRLLGYRRLLEQHSGKCSTSMVFVPNRSDVLLGRGKGYFNHVGNIRYRNLIDDLHSRYENATRDEKQQLAKEVVGIVHELGGRFLKYDGGIWTDIDDEAARMKVGHSFRALRSNNTTSVKDRTSKATKTSTMNYEENRTTAIAPTPKRMCR